MKNLGYSQNFLVNKKLVERLISKSNIDVTDYVIEKMNYKKSTISFLNNILNYFSVDNHLDKYLSSLSKYNHRSMEEIYELAQAREGF